MIGELALPRGGIPDLEDQALLQMWLRGQNGNNEGEGGPRPRRFDSTQLVDNEIIGSFIDRQFLDPEDDRVLEGAAGIRQ